MSKEPLSPCPFCDSEDVNLKLLGDAEMAIACNHCLAVGPLAGCEDDAIEFWNERHDGVDADNW